MIEIPFVDFAPRVSSMRAEIEAAIARVLDSGWFILGPEVEAFERELAAALGTHEAVAVANGTEALSLALLAHGIGAGDEVVTSAMSAAFSGLAISAVGARPVFADIDPVTLNVTAETLEQALTPRTRALIPVHLYGHPCDLDPILALAASRDLVVVEDACQAHGALYRGRAVGEPSGLAALSFYPTKNLGAFGDGGALLVEDPAVATRLRRLRNGGQSAKYRHDTFGLNSRLDEMQAALLRVGLEHLDGWTERRRLLAAYYSRELASSNLLLQVEQPWARSVWHLFVVRHPRRDALAAALRARGVGTLVHYPTPLHRQGAFAALDPPSLPAAERAGDEVLSLPLYPELTDAQAAAVAAAVRAACAELDREGGPR